MKLFAVYIGGEHERAHIELHDMRFILAERIEDTVDEIRRQWWGIPASLHLDGWAELSQAEGYRITLKREPATDTSRKLFYVNVGGYDSGQFTELHRNIFVVAESEAKAKVAALKQVKHWESFHRDDQYEAEQCFDLETQLDGRWHIHLTQDATATAPNFTCGYKKLAS